MGFSLVGLVRPVGATVALMLTLPIPVAVEFLGEQFGRLRYDPNRQIVVTAIAAPALGFGFARVVADRTDPWFWLMVAVFAVPCAAVSIVQAQRAQQINQATRAATETQRPFLREFDSAEEFQAYLDAAGDNVSSPEREWEVLTNVPVTRQELTGSRGRISDDEAVERIPCP
jgi:hypothetical protein